MNGLNSSKPENVAIAQDSIIIKFSIVGCLALVLVGGSIFAVNQGQATPTAQKVEDKIQTATPPKINIIKPPSPITIEEGSAAWYCVENGGGDGCLERDRFAPRYRVEAAPKPPKTYQDRLWDYGMVPGCGRYLNGKPNCY